MSLYLLSGGKREPTTELPGSREREIIEEEIHQVLEFDMSKVKPSGKNGRTPFTLHHEQFLTLCWKEITDQNTGLQSKAQKSEVDKLKNRISYLERLIKKHNKQPHVTDTTSSSKI